MGKSEPREERVRLDQVDQLPGNYNDHPLDQLLALQDSLRIFGQVRRVVLWPVPDQPGRFYAVAGWGTCQAAVMDGREEIAATVLPADGWSQDLVVAYAIADNETARLSRPQRQRLAELVGRLSMERSDLIPAMGLSAKTVEDLVAVARRAHQAALPLDQEEEDGGPPPDPGQARQAILDRWRVQPGDIWRLGDNVVDHVLVVADATLPASWEAGLHYLGQDQVDGVITSPPYANQRSAAYGGIPAENYASWWWSAVEPVLERFLAETGSLFLNVKAHAEDGRRLTYDLRIVLGMEGRGWSLIDTYCWKKNGYPGRFTNRLKNAWEPIYQLSRSAPPAHNILALGEVRERAEDGRGFRASRRALAEVQGGTEWGDAPDPETGLVLPSNVIIAPPDSTGILGEDHPARFPIKLPLFFVRGWSVPGRRAIWADPFAGSGTTLIAVHRLGQVGLAIERSPDYAAFILERWAAEIAESWGPERAQDPDLVPELVDNIAELEARPASVPGGYYGQT